MDFDVDDTMSDTPSTSLSTPEPSNPRPSPSAWSLSSLSARTWMPSTHPEWIGHRFTHNDRRYTVVARAASRSGAPSWIWQEGSEIRWPGYSESCWLCHHCWDKSTVTILAAKQTTKPVQHLRIAHKLNSDGPIVSHTPAQPTVLEQEEAALITPRVGIVTQVDLQAFKRALITWLILAHIALSCIEQESFRALIALLNPAMKKYLYRKTDSVRKLILDEFRTRRDKVREDLQAARSKIHISFDLWTSPNSLAMNGVVAHYLTKNFTLKAVLLGLRRVEGSHSGENIAVTVIDVIKDFKRQGRLLCDRQRGDNDTCIAEVCKQLNLSRPQSQRLRCFGHIMNRPISRPNLQKHHQFYLVSTNPPFVVPRT